MWCKTNLNYQRAGENAKLVCTAGAQKLEN